MIVLFWPWVQIAVAFLLDLLIGDPRGGPHPVRWMGAAAKKAEEILRPMRSISLRMAGVLAVLFVVGGSAGTAYGLLWLSSLIHPLLGVAAAIVTLASTIAVKDLATHARAVLKALEAGDLSGAREKVGMIVGRDTREMDEAGIVQAATESVAENTVDGVTAPLFYALLFGPVGAVAYKAINTLDSSFGYTNERYLEFGWASAKLDDLANYLPARLTVLALALAAFLLRLRVRDLFVSVQKTAALHASPNAGYPEAAFAGALGVRFGGSRSYGGVRHDLPELGNDGGTVDRRTLRDSIRLMATGSVVFLVTGLALHLLAGFLAG